MGGPSARAASQDHDPAIATLVHAQIDPATTTLTYASAGHLPMLIVPGNARGLAGETQILHTAEDPPIGVVTSQAYAQRHTSFNPADTLIAFTDGLIERRRHDLTDELHALTARISNLPDTTKADPETLADAILQLAPLGPGADDTTLLVLTA